MEMNESTDRTFTSAPPPLSARTGAKARAMRRGPKKFVSISARAASMASGASDAELRQDTSVVDNDRKHRRTLRARVGDVVGAGHVEPDRDDVGVGDARGVAGGAVDLGAGVEQRLRDGGARARGWLR